MAKYFSSLKQISTDKFLSLIFCSKESSVFISKESKLNSDFSIISIDSKLVKLIRLFAKLVKRRLSVFMIFYNGLDHR